MYEIVEMAERAVGSELQSSEMAKEKVRSNVTDRCGVCWRKVLTKLVDECTGRPPVFWERKMKQFWSERVVTSTRFGGIKESV